MLSVEKLPSIQENTAKTGVGTVIETAPVPFFSFSGLKRAKSVVYFLHLFAPQRSNKSVLKGGFELGI